MAKTFIIEKRTFCYEDGMGGWTLHRRRQFKNRKAAETAVTSLNKRASEFDQFRLRPM